MKKFIITTLLSTGFLGFGACTCDDYIPYWNITDYNITVSDPWHNSPVNGVIETDTLRIDLDFETQFLTEQRAGFFLNTALAMQKCPEDGDEGMKDLLTGFTIVSDAPFNDFQPGLPLNALVLINETIPVEDWVQSMQHADHYERITLYITEKPEEFKQHKFTISMSFASGKVIAKETEKVIWN